MEDGARPVTIGFRHHDGTISWGQANAGSLMTLAVELGVAGIEGQCGGYLACGTCHVHVSPDWIERIGSAPPDEVLMLEFEPGFSPLSRLSCQIELSSALDGLIVTVPGA
jgi:2Fe-2S ferredoxin